MHTEGITQTYQGSGEPYPSLDKVRARFFDAFQESKKNPHRAEFRGKKNCPPPLPVVLSQLYKALEKARGVQPWGLAGVAAIGAGKPAAASPVTHWSRGCLWTSGMTGGRQQHHPPPGWVWSQGTSQIQSQHLACFFIAAFRSVGGFWSI